MTLRIPLPPIETVERPFYDGSEIRLLCCQISGVIHLSVSFIDDARLLLFILIYWDFQTIYTVVCCSLFYSCKTICRYLSADRIRF